MNYGLCSRHIGCTTPAACKSDGCKHSLKNHNTDVFKVQFTHIIELDENTGEKISEREFSESPRVEP